MHTYPKSYLNLWSDGVIRFLTIWKIYISIFKRFMGNKLGSILITGGGLVRKRFGCYLLLVFFIFLLPNVAFVRRVNSFVSSVSYSCRHDQLLIIKLHDPLIMWCCEITWQTKTIICPLPEYLWQWDFAQGFFLLFYLEVIYSWPLQSKNCEKNV